MSNKYGYLANLTPGDLIITVNRRLASHLHWHFDQAQSEQNLAWQSPEIVPLSQWLTELWAQSNPQSLLLDSTMSRFVWQSILTAENTDYPLLDSNRAAEQAQQAWQLLQQWRVPLAALDQDGSEDVAAFVRWATRFQERCAQNNWIDAVQLPALVRQALSSAKFHLPQRITLVGFDSIPPDVKNLLDAFAQHCEIIVPAYSTSAHSSQRIQLAESDSEFRVMAQWAKQQWQNHPDHTIACVIPNLLAERVKVERIFADEFGDELKNAVNIAGGESLLNLPIIQVAMTLLELMSERTFQRPKLTALLLSPYLQGGISEWQQRALLDRRLRRSHEDSFTVDTLMTQETSLQHCPQLQRLLTTAPKLIALQSGSTYPSQWAAHFVKILSHFVWPGERSLDSTEFQQVSSLQQQLRRYAGLDSLLKQQTLDEALASLRQLLSGALFQAESHHAAPIQVLGLLEASGLQVDQLWLCNMNDDTWPPAPAPNPFIPIRLQRELSMPRSSGAHELQFARQIMDRLHHSTSQLIASYSLQKPDENRALSPSPLTHNFDDITLDQWHLKMPLAPTANPQTEHWQDDVAPKLQANENIRGGATVLKRQAECPFWAFAEIRLQAKPFDEIELGLSAAERGSLVHAVLAELWRELGNSEQLHRISEDKLIQLVQNSVNKVLIAELNDAHTLSDKMSTAMRELESQRLQRLVLQWLEVEKKRSPFSVTAIEKPFELTLGKLSLHLQIDRIDTLEDGSHIIIDYKTGSPSPSSWFGDRPDEPQLPLYALQDPAKVRGLAFAQVRVQSLKFNGLTAESGVLPGVKAAPTPWPEMIDQWQSTLSILADNFCHGDAAVAPKKFPATCAYCHLASVCRIHERETA